MKTYTSPTIESIGGGGHEVDKPIWFFVLIAVAVVAVAVAAFGLLFSQPEIGQTE